MAEEVAIYCISGPVEGKEFPMPASGSMTIGRGTDADLFIMDPSLSRTHCRLDYSDDILTIRDLGSTNGTYVNGKKLTPNTPTPIDDGDIFKIHGIKFEVRVYSDEDDETEEEADGDDEHDDEEDDETVDAIEPASGTLSDDSPGGTYAYRPGAVPMTPAEDAGEGGDPPPHENTRGRRRLNKPTKKEEKAQEKAKRLIGKTIDKYTIVSLLGIGGMGTVYLAEQAPPFKRTVALKVIKVKKGISDMQVDRFIRGALVNSRLNHPNVVALYDAGRLDNIYFVSMEYVKGVDVESLMKRDGKLSIDMSVDIVSQALDALIFCHEKQIVHRDIKPGNLLVTQSGQVKLTDMGIAKVVQGVDTRRSHLTMAGAAVGTPNYMSPEQFNDSATVDHRTDIYSLGVTLYELVTGRVPFEGNSLIGLARQVTFKKPTPPNEIEPSVPVELAEIIEKAMAKKTDDRFQTAAEFKNALLAFQQP